MSWKVIDPTIAAGPKTIVARVDIPFFPDEIEYEEIIGRAFSDPSSRDFMASGGVIVLGTNEGYEALMKLMASSVAVPERTVKEKLLELAIARKIAVLRWSKDA